MTDADAKNKPMAGIGRLYDLGERARHQSLRKAVIAVA
jgi:hypothetical protein